MEYLAHFNSKTGYKQTLKNHLMNVAKTSKDAVKENISFHKFKYEDLRCIAEYIGFYHDFGKYTDYFQDYLIKNKWSRYRKHSHISACVLYKILSKSFKGNMENHHNLCAVFLAYLCVRLHHGNLTLDIDLADSNIWKYLNKQQDNLIKNLEHILKDLKENISIEKEELKKILSIKDLESKTLFKGMPYLFRNKFKNSQWFFMLIYYFSLLIDSDKLDAAGLLKKERNKKTHALVERYLNSISINQKTKINKLRNDARKEIMNKIKNLKDDEIKEYGIFTLTAPTGIGKTLSALQAALLIGERLKKIYSYQPRIITAIPFINIIEQTKGVYKNVFEDTADVLVHHQFTDISKAGYDNEDLSLDKKLLQVEAWESDVIITTFVQFFHSILTNKGTALKKLNKVAGSIVILDEIQLIPEKYLGLVGAVLYKISKHYGTKFILMTATQPKIIKFAEQLLNEEEKITSFELLDSSKKYFRFFNRTKLIPLLDNKLKKDEFINLIKSKRSLNDKVLVVVNTIKRSIEIYEYLSSDKSIDCEVLYLSTNIIPIHREEVIKKAKQNIKTQTPFILVSTQTVEAGVDLDFDIAFRDLGPLESIIQVAGRVNRENKCDIPKPIYLVDLESDYEYVYSMHHIYYTRNFLKKYDVIHEQMYFELINKYYTNLLKQGCLQESIDIWEKGIKKLNFEEIKKFKLIKRLGDFIDVFIEIDNDAAKLANNYEKNFRLFLEAKTAKEKYQFKTMLKQITKQMRKYMISIRTHKKMINKPKKFCCRNGVEASFYWVPLSKKEVFYNDKTGFNYYTY